MKLQTRIEFVIIVIFLLGWLIAGGAIYALELRKAQEDTVRTAKVLLTTAAAARNYTSDEITPLLQKLDEKDFLPQTIPSYAAQQLFVRVHKEFEGYTYSERLFNPTNPKDLAEGWQIELIQAFIKNQKLTEIIGERIAKTGEEIFYVAQPILIQSKACLECHSTPENAPVNMIKSYGSSNGFGWKLNEIVGTRLISIPTSVPKNQAWESIFSYLLLIASIFLIAYTAFSLIIRRWILNPLDRIADTIEQISLSKVEISRLPEERSHELGKLTKSINRLLTSLKKALSK